MPAEPYNAGHVDIVGREGFANCVITVRWVRPFGLFQWRRVGLWMIRLGCWIVGAQFKAEDDTPQ